MVTLVQMNTDNAQTPTQPVWELDEHTRQLGRGGVAAARAILRSGRCDDQPALDTPRAA